VGGWSLAVFPRSPGFASGIEPAVEPPPAPGWNSRLKDSSFPRNAMRMGPLTMDVRRSALSQIKAIQDDMNRRAERQGRAVVSLIDSEEERRILELIAANTWPQGWTGNEPRADLNIPQAVTKDLSVMQNQLLA